MTLINCNECNKEISDQAAACPNCGNPTDNQLAKPNKSRGGLFEFIGFAMIAAGIVSCTSRGGEMGWWMPIGSLGFIVFIAGRFMR